MSTLTPTLPAVPAADPQWVPSPLYRMTVEQYEALVDSGAFNDRDRFHLINGCLVAKMTQNDPHCTADDLCGEALRAIISPGWYVRAAKPVRLPGQKSKPEPDRCVVRGTIRDYSRRTPGAAHVANIVEVAESSLAEDRKMATEVYGPAGIPVYWIVNLIDRQVEVFTGPGPGGYASCAVFRPGDAIPVEIAGRQLGAIAVDDILP
jgi:Uma2 family endonuclease